MPHDSTHPPHDHGRVELGPAFRWAVGLNLGFLLFEAGAGLLAGSLALLADAAHNLTDVAGLLIAWGAAALATRAGTARYTWGLGRATILAAALNGAAILIGVVFVVHAALGRFADPVPVPGLTVLLVALVGIAVNAGSALLFRGARGSDLNARGAFLHMAADAAVSAAVVLAAAGMLATGWSWLDPAVAIAVSLLIALTAWTLTRDALRLLLDGVPETVDRRAVADWIAAQPGVAGVHDLHIWALSTTRTALAAHVVSGDDDPDAVLDRITLGLTERFGIGHATLQFERAPCARAAACVGA